MKVPKIPIRGGLIVLAIMVVFFGLALAFADYTPDNYNNVQSTLAAAYTPDNYNNVLSVFGSDEAQVFVEIQFIAQAPPDIDALNAMDQIVNITYSINATTNDLNISSVKLAYKVNTSTEEGLVLINGTSVAIGFLNETGTNVSDVWTFRLDDNDVYPGTYNIDKDTTSNTTHTNYDLDGINEVVKIKLFNVSNLKQFSFLELMAINQTTTTNDMRTYYCNSSYTTGTVWTSDFCTNFFNLQGGAYNHTHGEFSDHQLIPFAMNTTSGKIGDIIVTNDSFFVFRGIVGLGGWNVSYVPNITRTDQCQTSTNKGAAWSNLSGTVDLHLHQFDGTDTFWYYACGSDSVGNQNCTSDVMQVDLLEMFGLPPTAPDVYAPTSDTYRLDITINYTESISPNAYPIAYYNITLVDVNGTFNLTIAANNSLNLSLIWNSSLANDGEYLIAVEAVDNFSQSSFGFSENITIDNIYPDVDIQYSGLLCYQETANVTSACGGLSTGSYGFDGNWTNDTTYTIDKAYDGNWATRASPAYAFNDGFDGTSIFYVNYSKPTSIISQTHTYAANGLSYWMVKVGDTSTPDEMNISVPYSCWEDQDPLRFKVLVTRLGGYNVTLSCWEGNSWEEVYVDTGASSGPLIWEEAMYWYAGCPGLQFRVWIDEDGLENAEYQSGASHCLYLYNNGTETGYPQCEINQTVTGLQMELSVSYDFDCASGLCHNMTTDYQYLHTVGPTNVAISAANGLAIYARQYYNSSYTYPETYDLECQMVVTG